jgi:protein arginine kinase activator
MKCQYCGKNEAEYQFTITVGMHQIERYLCADCAKQLGYESEGTFLSFDQLFSDFLSETPQKQEKGIICPRCGSVWSEIRATGKVGCAECYRVFADRLLPYVQKLYGSTNHVGRIPNQVAQVQEAEMSIARLQMQLDAAVAEQNYEQAAVYRDEIRALKGGSQQ